MKCPHCPDVTLLMSDRQGVEIDYCPQCRGVWLDRGELDKLIERSVAAPATVPSAPPHAEPAPYRQAAPAVPYPSPSHAPRRPDFEDSDYGHHGSKGYRKPKSWLSEIFD